MHGCAEDGDGQRGAMQPEDVAAEHVEKRNGVVEPAVQSDSEERK